MNLEKIISLLKCPYCQNGDLDLLTARVISCKTCNNAFEVIDGVPVLLKPELLCLQEKKQKEWFDSHYAKFSPQQYILENWRLSMLKRIFERPFKKNIKTYLDIGCGATGYTAIEAARRNGWLAIGVDLSIEAVLRANALAKKNNVYDRTFFLVCSAEDLPFRSNVFDYVSAISVLEHLEHDYNALQEISRVLYQDGYAYICVPNTYKRIPALFWLLYLYLDVKIGHKRHYALEKLTDRINAGGSFELQEAFYNGHVIKFIQILLERLHLITDNQWWEIEKRDINGHCSGVQLNALYRKNK